MGSRTILCIDLKSFFASVECVSRNLDPFKTPLVVAEPNRNGAITLAVTPYLKKLGVKSRCRVYEIPKNIKYLTAKPRMNLYIKKSKEVIDVYLEYISSEDLHIYSIDECFLDITDYLKLYKKTPYELAVDILNRIKEKTNLYATAGIGPNLLLAKVSMDIEAKNNDDFIAYWTYDDIKTKLWNIAPLSKMWGIGLHLEKKLNALGLYKIGDIANYNKYKLKDKFGIIGEEIWNHANGIDMSLIRDFNRESKEKSISNSQVLFKDYYNEEIYIIFKEMISILTCRLRKERLLTKRIHLSIIYSKNIGGCFSASHSLDNSTNDDNIIYKNIINIFKINYEIDTPIRKVSIYLSKLEDDKYLQLNLFENLYDIKNRNSINKTIDYLNNKYGKNTLLKASSLLENSTIKERNTKVGGHNAG